MVNNFTLSDKVNKEKLFLSHFSEVTGTRYDPSYVLYKKKTDEYKYDTVPLRKLLLQKPQYGANEPGVVRTTLNETRYVRITDIDENGILKNKLGATCENIDDKYLLNEGDIIIARSGNTVGKAYIHRKCSYSCLFAGYMIRFVVDTNQILPDYLFTFTQLDVYKKWIKAVQRTAGQPNINAEEYGNLEIPLPDEITQSLIIQKINKAYSLKQQKEEEAQKLLDSIDDYLLSELGITLPEEDDTGIKGRIFTRKFSKVSGGRFDPHYYKYCSVTMGSNKFTEHSLRTVAHLSKGQSITKEKVIPGEFPVIAGGQKSPYSIDRFNFSGETITVSASGAYSGYVWYHHYQLFASDCTVIKVKNEKEIMPRFLFEVLKLKQKEIYNLQQGAGQPHVYASDLQKIMIPLPEDHEQEIMCDYIEEIRNQAKRLKQEAKDILDTAKKEVETMILGGNNEQL